MHGCQGRGSWEKNQAGPSEKGASEEAEEGQGQPLLWGGGINGGYSDFDPYLGTVRKEVAGATGPSHGPKRRGVGGGYFPNTVKECALRVWALLGG